MLNFQLWNTGVRSLFIASCTAPAWENPEQGALQIQPTLLSGISNFPIKLHKDAHRLLSPLPHVASSSYSRWAVHLKAGTAGTSGWDLLLEAHSSNLHFQCPSSIKSCCFWLFRQCHLSCIPLFSVNIFTFVTPNWLNTTQAFRGKLYQCLN